MGKKEIPNPGEVIRHSRIACGYSLRQCAELIGISPAHLSDVERGNRAVTIPVAFALGRTLTPYVHPRQLLVWQLDRAISRMKADLDDSVDEYLNREVR